MTKESNIVIKFEDDGVKIEGQLSKEWRIETDALQEWLDGFRITQMANEGDTMIIRDEQLRDIKDEVVVALVALAHYVRQSDVQELKEIVAGLRSVVSLMQDGR